MVAETNEIGLQTASTPVWLEPRVVREVVSSFFSPSSYGFGIPEGHRQPVLLIPGFLADDVSMWPLWFKLTFRNYRPFFSELGRNDTCLNDQFRRLARRVEEIHSQHGYRDKKIDIVGQSLGGLLAWALKYRYPDLVERVITLGTPQSPEARINPLVARAAARISQELQERLGRKHCFTAECSCVFAESVKGGTDPDVCIYSDVDGIAESAGTQHPTDASRDRLVPGATHLGMGFHPGVYREITSALNGR